MRTVSFKAVALGGALALLSGCVGGNPLVNKGRVKIRTSPEGALATSEYGDSCTTPCSLFLRTSKGGTIRISKAGYEAETVSIGTYFDEAEMVFDGAREAVRPDPFRIAVNGLLTLVDAKGQYRKLDTRRVNVALLLLGSRPQTPKQVPLATALPAPTAGGSVRRLSREQIEAIVGPPLASEAAAVTASSSSPR